MRWTYDLCGAEPIIKDCPIYDATNLENGELLMKGTTSTGTGNSWVSLISSYAGDATADAIDSVGILLEDQYGANGTITPSATFAGTTGVRHGKVIINPFAVYRAEYGQAAADDSVVGTGNSTTAVGQVMATAGEAVGGFIYFTHIATNQDALKGSLRMVVSNSIESAGVTALAAAPVAATELFICIQPAHNYTMGVNAAATGLSSSGTTMTDLMSNAEGTNLRIVESWIEAPGIGFVPLVGYKNRDTNLDLGALDNLPSTTKFYSDIMQKDHLFGAQE